MQTPELQAFEVHPIVQWRSVPFHIQSVELNGTDLLVGTSQGQLLVYDLPEGSVGAVPSLRLTKKDFLKTSRKPPISQLLAVPELNILLCLADTYVHVHDLTTFTSLYTIERSKGTLLFAADLHVRGMPQADTHRLSETRSTLPVDRLTLQLCCIVKRRFFVFEVGRDEAKHIKDQPLPDTPQTAVWCGRKLFFGFKREYDQVEIETGRVVEVPTESTGSFDRLAVRLPNNTFALTAERDGRPVVIFKDIEGKPLTSYGIQWEDWPRAIDVYGPYILGVTDKGIEVRFNDETSKLMQLIHLDSPQFLVHGHTILAASPSALWQLHPVPYDQQIDSLLDVNRFVDAKKIEAAMPGTPEERMKRRYNMDKAHAYYEFNRKKHFKVALDLLKGIEVSPATVLRLYPWLLPKHTPAEGVPGAPQLTPQQKQEAIAALILYLTEKRTQLYKFDSKAEAPDEADKRKKLMSIVDTTLLICYVRTGSSLLRSFVRVNNHCDISESEKVLKSADKLEELVLLYQNRGLHRQALELLRSNINKTTPDPKTMDEEECKAMAQRRAKWMHAMISHLQNLKPEHVGLVVEYSSTILDIDEKQGLGIFMSKDFPNVKTFPRVPIMQHLQEHYPHLLTQYLEFVVTEWNDTSREIHTALALSYLNAVLKMKKTPPLSSPERQRLYRFLRTSDHIDASLIMRRVASAGDVLVEERAVLLGQLNRHAEALRILANDVADPSFAEDYCNDNYDPHDLDRRNLYMVLLEHYLRPASGPPKTQQALTILGKHSDKVNALKALDMLPLDTKISEIEDFLMAILTEREHTRRAVAVQANLAKTEQLQVSERRIAIHSKHFKVTEDSLCFECRKPIRTHAFAIYPCGTLVHLHCMENESTCPRHSTRGRCRLTLN
ncbi:hypothetical protein PTSG_01557 [Salpingoeca rosetta]|uniref:CNH domain-containing protein n=1 Tax=Salpingoeca rosetta (strain ATCC 50818 / BSB-021) TaxID=946362 RepID=F2U0P7_SALR5|nr:uncharacterized protein PTSG_01557 [Salpingoeca rosetta]EGD80975.1 hypothetical protein PTSG_01557 [Salpingoeca rosetta]|eukprot:XP_004997536.1 hypothetical protein PTSG_01557 [Salpingoeca rosetta]